MWSAHSDRALAVLRRNEGTCPSSPSDDEVGELKGAIRAAAMFAPPICGRSADETREIGADLLR
jgi:hypothetical protein